VEPLGPDYDESQERRHGLWGLGVLVMIALVVVAFIIIFTGGGSGKSNNNATSSYGSGAFSDSPSKAHSSTPAGHSSSSASSSSVPRAGCVGSCTAEVAALADAINALRTQHGLAAVAASESANAQACAAARGGGSACVPHYMYARVSSTDGAAAAKALEGVNESWLLAKDATRIEVGFSPIAGGGYNCAVLRFP